jgi:L-cystine uptake protein TcyP (sodium:dicarboxylate symporter family)
MDYEKMSNEELYQLLLEKLPGEPFEEVADDNRQTVIAILQFFEDKEGG